MKSIKNYFAVGILILSVSSCVAPPRPPKPPAPPKHPSRAQILPPGQAKKVYATKSARPFAPGQNK